jgi:hypothetical protein
MCTERFIFETAVTNLSSRNKVLTYVEYRAVSGVFQNIDPPPPQSTQRVCPPPAPKAVMGVGVNILEDARHRNGLLQYTLSTAHALSLLFIGAGNYNYNNRREEVRRFLAGRRWRAGAQR